MFDGFDEEQDRSFLKTIYGDPNRLHFRRTLQDEYLTWLDSAKATEEERQSKRYATPEHRKKNLARAITTEIARLKQDQEEREPIESERRKVEILLQSVPDSRALDHLLRYESSLERALDRTLTQLERLQRMRKGQPVLPPVKMDFDL
jgi:DNA repair ATPase RecN